MSEINISCQVYHASTILVSITDSEATLIVALLIVRISRSCHENYAVRDDVVSTYRDI